MVKDYGNIPALYSAGLYITGQGRGGGAEKTGGKTDDREAFNKPCGASPHRHAQRTLHLRPLRQRGGHFYIRRCERKGDRLVNTKIRPIEGQPVLDYDEKCSWRACTLRLSPMKSLSGGRRA